MTQQKSTQNRLPKYRHQKSRDLAVVRLNGKDKYLGKYDSPESYEAYNRVVAEWIATGGVPAPSETAPASRRTINDLLSQYLDYVDGYYVKNGRPTSEAGLIRLAIQPLRELYGRTDPATFGPRALKALQQRYIDSGLCRREVNRRTGLIIRFFKWAVSNELAPPSTHHALKTVPGIRKGRVGVRESPPVKPITDAVVDAVLPHVSRQVRTMIELQRWAGMRPGEVTIIRTMDVDTSCEPWTYTPASHKTEHHGRGREIQIGPKARSVLTPWLRPDEPERLLFNPREAEDERYATLRKLRKTPVQPSQKNRRKRGKRSRQPGEQYAVKTYHHSIARGCRQAFPHPIISKIKRKNRTPEQVEELKKWERAHRFHPNQLRHTTATKIRKEFGLDTARAVLGHSHASVTEMYAERDKSQAAAAMEKVG